MDNRQIELVKKLIESKDQNYIYENVKNIFGYDKEGMPNVVDGKVLYLAWQAIKNTSAEIEHELMEKRFYRNSQERYEEFVQSHMKKIDGTTFLMGSASDAKIKYCGEEPQHKVQLNTYYVSDIVVSQELYAKYNPQYTKIGDVNMPACYVSWYDAIMFSKWINCRLLSEAEWEYACRGNSNGYWCCEKEEDLGKYAWYSENSDGYIHQIAQLKPNSYGLYDMHGNVWEWTADSYEAEYYSKSPLVNPINKNENSQKVCRGGSIQAFSEMCRSTFRTYESIDFKASDIGFRLARNGK